MIPQGVQVKGIGAPSLASQGGSVIQAVNGFPNNTAIINVGNVSNNGTRLEELSIDCNGQTGATGALWIDSEEQSALRHVLITGCPGTGLSVSGNSAQSQNAGPFEDLYVVSGANNIPVANTVGISIDKGDSEIRGIHGATVNFTGANVTPTNCMVINTGGSYTDIHLEGCTNGINVSAPAHHSVFLYNIDCSTNVTDCIHITAGTVYVINVGGTSTNFINDTVTGNVIPGSISVLRQYPEPKFVWSGYYNGNLTTLTNWISFFSPELAITVTRVTASVITAGVTCATPPVVTVTNGTASQTLTIANSNNGNSTGAIAVNFAGGTNINMELTTAAAGCGTIPANMYVTVQYKMQ